MNKQIFRYYASKVTDAHEFNRDLKKMGIKFPEVVS